MANPEDHIQASIVDHVRLVAPHTVILAVPNGGLRSKREASRLKWTGVLAGTSDLEILYDNGRCAFIEVKSGNNGCSDAQRDFLLALLELKIPFAVAYSLEDARLALAMFGIHTREAAVAGAAE